jgi:hypothetical protein
MTTINLNKSKTLTQQSHYYNDFYFYKGKVIIISDCKNNVYINLDEYKFYTKHYISLILNQNKFNNYSYMDENSFNLMYDELIAFYKNGTCTAYTNLITN